MIKLLIILILISIIILSTLKEKYINKKKKLTIFTSSFNLEHENKIIELINKIDPKKIEIIVGSKYEGLMGSISDTYSKKNGKIISAQVKQFTNKKYKDDYIFDTLRERTLKLIELGDIYLVLPGGIGTSNELFEVLVKNNIKDFNKKIYIFNINGFYNHLINHLKYLKEKNYIYGSGYKGLNLFISDNIDEIAQNINNN
jgi:uncharacterized protein (TIGR00730 family)